MAYDIWGSHRYREAAWRPDRSPKGDPVWTKREDKLLRRLVPDYDALEIEISRRSRKAIQLRAHVLRLTRPLRYWRADEVSRLRRLYPKADRLQLLESFPGVSHLRIRNKAYKLGLKRPRTVQVKSGVPIFDAMRLRALELNMTYQDVDEEARTRWFMQRVHVARQSSINLFSIERALKVLGGRLVIEWQD